jgi:hypothetical protein
MAHACVRKVHGTLSKVIEDFESHLQLLVLCARAPILKITSKVYEKLKQEYEWIVHIVLYQHVKF